MGGRPAGPRKEGDREDEGEAERKGAIDRGEKHPRGLRPEAYGMGVVGSGGIVLK